MIHCGKPAAYVVRDLGGAEWFVCEEHGAETTTWPYGRAWILRTPLADWFKARAMPVLDDSRRVCNEARTDAAD